MKSEFILEGLNCANCAVKIETKLGHVPGFEAVSLNLATQTLIIKANGHSEQLLDFLQREVDAIEEGVVVKEKWKQLKDRHEPPITFFNRLMANKIWIRLSLGSVAFLVALIFKLNASVEFILFLLAYLTIGGDVLLKAFRNILRGKVFDENFLMSIATIGAFAIKEYPEGVVVMLFYQIGELFQDMAVNKSRKSIASLMDIRPDVAFLQIGDAFIEKPVEVIQVNDIIRVRPGERIPLDGKVIFGHSMVDTSPLTGESVPRSVKVDEPVISGTMNQTGLLHVVVEKIFTESTVSRILDLVENAAHKKAETEKFITKFAKAYTPVVVFIALALATLPPLLIEGATFTDWLQRALIFLVVSCPCALVISIPLGFFGGIGGASKYGILIKGSHYLEGLNKVNTIVFDKTGTLTKGVFKVSKVHAIDADETGLLRIAALGEQNSNHPIAKSILLAYGKEIEETTLEDHEEISGKGIRTTVDGKVTLIGNHKLMEDYQVAYDKSNVYGTTVYVAIQEGSVYHYKGYITISDEIRDESHRIIQELKTLGIKKTMMLTGDRKAVADEVGKQIGIDEVYSELLPHEKVAQLEEILRLNQKGKTIFVGDGINDAPVIARADIGIAMGGIGSDAAIEAADVVLMTDELSKLSDALKIARRTKAIVWQNIGFAMGVKLLVLVLGAGGLASMWEAVFADVGVALLAIFNAMRIINKPIK